MNNVKTKIPTVSHRVSGTDWELFLSTLSTIVFSSDIIYSNKEHTVKTIASRAVKLIVERSAFIFHEDKVKFASLPKDDVFSFLYSALCCLGACLNPSIVNHPCGNLGSNRCLLEISAR